jgi:hypothetical protein
MNLNPKKKQVIFAYNKDNKVDPQAIVTFEGGWKIFTQVLIMYTIIWLLLYTFSNTPELKYSVFFGYLFGLIILGYRYYYGGSNLWGVNIDNKQTGMLSSTEYIQVILDDTLKNKLPTHTGFIMDKAIFNKYVKEKKIITETTPEFFSKLKLKKQWTQAQDHTKNTTLKEHTLYHLNYIILSLGILLGVKNYKKYKSIFPWMLYVLLFSISQIGTWLWAPKLQKTGLDLTSSMVINILTKSLGITVIIAILNITDNYIL